MFSIASRFSLIILFITSSVSFINAQYTRNGDTITRKNNRVVVDKSGFPAQLFACKSNTKTDNKRFVNGMTTEAIHFHIIDSTTRKDVKFTSSGVNFMPVKNKKIPLTWQATNTAPSLEMKVEGLLYRKNHIFYQVTIRALKNISLADVKFHLPLVIEKEQIVQGLGRKGVLSDTVQLKWPEDLNPSPSVTKINAGDGSISLSAPIINTSFTNYPPLSLTNERKGGIWLGIKGKSLLEETYSGPRSLQQGEELHYNFFLMIEKRM